jgi:hypothetical protein
VKARPGVEAQNAKNIAPNMKIFGILLIGACPFYLLYYT